MRSRLYFHLVWTTRGRAPALDRPAADFLERYLRAVARQERARVLALGAVRSHVHVLIEAHPMTVLPRLIQRFKGGSSALINREGHTDTPHAVRWAKGYAIHTVSPRAVPHARSYVEQQGEHHPTERIPEQHACGGESR